MSQKPRTGAPAGTAPKVAAKETTVKAPPLNARPIGKPDPVAKVEPTAKPAKTEPVVKLQPAVKAEPISKVVIAAPVAPAKVAHVVVSPVASAAVATPVAVPPQVVAPPAKVEPVVKPMMEAPKAVVSEPIAALAKTVDPVARTVTSAVREPVAAAVMTAAGATQTAPKTTTAAMDKAAAVTEAAVTPVVRAAAATKPTLTQGIKTMMKSTEDLVAFGQANMEAFMKSSQIWSAGVQELSKQIATSAKASFEESVSTFKAISTAKSVKEAMDLQSTFAKAALEKAMAESNKLTDASIKLTEQTLAPITARVTLAVETFGKAA